MSHFRVIIDELMPDVVFQATLSWKKGYYCRHYKNALWLKDGGHNGWTREIPHPHLPILTETILSYLSSLWHLHDVR